MIFKCNRITKDRDHDLDKGDVGYKIDQELLDIIHPCRIFLEQIIYWEEYKEAEDTPFYHNKESKIRIYTKDGPTIIILYRLEEFDSIMEKFENRTLKLKDN